MTATPDQPTSVPAVQVYLRVRPLVPEEEGHEVIEHKTGASGDGHHFRVRLPAKTAGQARTKVNPAFPSAPPLSGLRDAWKSYDGFAGVFHEDCNNQGVYEIAVRPVVAELADRNQSACVFTYGHTGSGKSHTLLGYHQEWGMYKFAARDLLEKIQMQDADKCLLVRVTELYKDTVVDLITSQPCAICQDAKGQVQVRGPMVQDEQGRIEQKLLGQLCSTWQQVKDCVEAACASRRVGTSTHHSQSSRSHLILELEIVTPPLMDQRLLLHTRDAHLTRLKWLDTERKFDKRCKSALPQWTLDYDYSKLRKEIREYEELVEEAHRDLVKMSANLVGTLVFCDLAGNEYARDAAGSTKRQFEESAEINKSLLAVKELIRSLRSSSGPGKSQHHIPYRDSKLTMCLKRHMQSRAVMLAHIGPSLECLKKTINTLNYSAMVSSTSPGQRGKENKP